MSAETVDVVERPATSLAPAAMRSAVQDKNARRTRTSGAWVSIALGLAALVVVLVFAIRNLSSVEVIFLSLHWTRLDVGVFVAWGLILMVVGRSIVKAVRDRQHRRNREHEEHLRAARCHLSTRAGSSGRTPRPVQIPRALSRK